MARTPAQRASLEKKALAEENKSEGMRSLYDAGYTVSEVKDLFGGPYGFAYGVATRWAAASGNPIPVAPREAKPKAAAKPAAKAKAKPAAKPAAKSTAKAAAAPVRSKAAIASANRRAAAKAAKAK